MELEVLKNRWLLANALLKGKALHSSSPQEIIIEVTNRCNLRCPMCIRTHLEALETKDLSLEEFNILLNRITNKTERIFLAGLGEPLLNPEIVAIIHKCSERGLRTTIHTNATLLSAELSCALLSAGLSSISISFDGATEETYEYYRCGADFNKVKQNILNFLEIKRALRTKVLVEIQMVIFKRNLKEINLFFDMWSIRGVDFIRIKNDHMRVSDESGIEENNLIFKKKSGCCAILWRGPATIDVDGMVYPCCMNSRDNLILGNIFSENMENLWCSDLANKLRNDFVKKRAKLATCRQCNIPLLPLFPCACGTLLNPFLSRKMLALIERWLYKNKA
jgi:radical SAM protein with 4Fe4S-binding SPASM domain